jgi:DNA-binding MarR family transcriptional regulator
MPSPSTNYGPFVGSMMRVANYWVLEQVYARVVEAGFGDIGRSHVGMLRNPGPEGRRPSDIAEQLWITKQSVNDLLGDMESRGYLVRTPDPSDRRARIIRLTTRGRRLHSVAAGAAREAEAAIAELLGPRRFAQLRGALELIVKHIADNDLPVRLGPEPLVGAKRVAPTGTR